MSHLITIVDNDHYYYYQGNFGRSKWKDAGKTPSSKSCTPRRPPEKLLTSPVSCPKSLQIDLPSILHQPTGLSWDQRRCPWQLAKVGGEGLVWRKRVLTRPPTHCLSLPDHQPASQLMSSVVDTSWPAPPPPNTLSSQVPPCHSASAPTHPQPRKTPGRPEGLSFCPPNIGWFAFL